MRGNKRKRRQKSLYVKWGIRFVGLILLAQIISYNFVLFSVLPDMTEKLNQGRHWGGDMFPNITEQDIEISRAIILDGMRRVMFTAAIVGSLLNVIGLGGIVRPIKRVTKATKQIARGDFDVKQESTTQDEIGQLIDNFNTMASELKKMDYLRKDFVSNVSHEFKTPITSIEGFAKMLKSNQLTPKQFEEYTDIIIKETGRLSTLSSNLLKLSMLEHRSFEPNKEKFFLDEQIRNAILLLQNQWEDKNIDFDIDMDETEINSNEELLSQVWINLLQNAVKFSGAGGTVAVMLKRGSGSVSVTIKDHGIGMSPEEQERIFERFYKADKSRSKEGNGLGLSIVKKITEILNGSVTFESEQGKGTSFTVTLPE